MRVVKGKLARDLRAKAHALKPVVMVGKNGVSAGVVATLNAALEAHELLKVKVHDTTELDRDVFAQELAALTQSYVVTVMGKIVTLYRPALGTDGKRPAHPQLVVNKVVLVPKVRKAGDTEELELEDEDLDSEDLDSEVPAQNEPS